MQYVLVSDDMTLNADEKKALQALAKKSPGLLKKILVAGTIDVVKNVNQFVDRDCTIVIKSINDNADAMINALRKDDVHGLFNSLRMMLDSISYLEKKGSMIAKQISSTM